MAWILFCKDLNKQVKLIVSLFEHRQTSHTMCAPVDGPRLPRGPDAAQRRGPLQHRDAAELRAVAGRPQTRGASADNSDVHRNNNRAREHLSCSADLRSHTNIITNWTLDTFFLRQTSSGSPIRA